MGCSQSATATLDNKVYDYNDYKISDAPVRKPSIFARLSAKRKRKENQVAKMKMIEAIGLEALHMPRKCTEKDGAKVCNKTTTSNTDENIRHKKGQRTKGEKVFLTLTEQHLAQVRAVHIGQIFDTNEKQPYKSDDETLSIQSLESSKGDVDFDNSSHGTGSVSSASSRSSCAFTHQQQHPNSKRHYRRDFLRLPAMKYERTDKLKIKQRA